MTTATDQLVERILKLKKERQAVILAHNYQLGEVQDIADFVGDSLELSRQAARTDAAVVVFCGVHFMAETASILSPDKKILLPDAHAGCPMANMITAPQLRERKKELPGAAVVCYVNTSAGVKAEADICCTSANAVKITESVPGDDVLFIPDKYLGQWVAAHTDKTVHLWNGYCPTHARILPEDINRLRKEHPHAHVVVHPECRPEVTALADAVLSTGGIIRYARREDVAEMIVGTESGIIHRLRKENPGKTFIPVSKKAVCPNMKKINLDKVLWALEDMAPEVKVPEPVRSRALKAVEKMLALS
ncbi:MAG: quinolinate synthase NadA [Chloroflexota bacterium]